MCTYENSFKLTKRKESEKMIRSGFLLLCWIPVYLCLCITPKVPCSPDLSIDITDSVYDSLTGSRTKDNITYNQYDYYVDNGTIRGCICNMKTCVRKCCPLYEEIGPEKACAPNLEVRGNYSDVVPNNLTYTIVSSFLVCQNKFRFQLYPVQDRETETFSIDTNGNLRYKAINLDADNYCLAYFSYADVTGALICISQYDDDHEPLYYYGMIISMPFLLATFLVYALLPDRNLPAKALMCYVLSLLFAYILLVTIQLNNLLDSASCKTLAFFCYFFFMASFFWMNASCLDIFFTFSGIRGLLGEKKKENRRFMYYSAYAWGVPVLMVGFAAIFTFEKTDNLTWATGIGEGQCWFRNGWPTGIYFYFPIATLLIVNIVLFSITTYKIKRVQRDTKMLKNVDSRKNRKYDNNDKQRYETDSDLVYLTDIELSESLQSNTINVYDFLEEDSGCFSFNLYVKLLFAMGINWSMEVISWAIMWRWSNVPEYVWVLTDFCNAVYGVFIFFIFVFKRNIWMMLKKRYLQFTGRPQQAHTLTSVNRTTVSQVSSSEA